MRDGLVCHALLGASAKSITLDLLEDIFAGLEGICCFLYAYHWGVVMLVGILIKVDRFFISLCSLSSESGVTSEEARAGLVGHDDGAHAILLHLGAASLLGVEVVVAFASSEHFARLGDFEALGV